MVIEEMGFSALVRSVCVMKYTIIMFIALDIDECAEMTDNCHRESNATCTDTAGSFICNCSEGFNGTGTFCTGKCDLLREGRFVS